MFYSNCSLERVSKVGMSRDFRGCSRGVQGRGVRLIRGRGTIIKGLGVDLTFFVFFTVGLSVQALMSWDGGRPDC